MDRATCGGGFGYKQHGTVHGLSGWPSAPMEFFRPVLLVCSVGDRATCGGGFGYKQHGTVHGLSGWPSTPMEFRPALLVCPWGTALLPVVSLVTNSTVPVHGLYERLAFGTNGGAASLSRGDRATYGGVFGYKQHGIVQTSASSASPMWP